MPSPWDSSLADRFAVAGLLRTLKATVASAVTDSFFADHPDWDVRYGERGRQFCAEDTAFHLEFLAGAIDSDSVEAFEQYVRWCVRMLAARHISREHLARHLQLLHAELERRLPKTDLGLVAVLLDQGYDLCMAQDSPTPAVGIIDRWSAPRRVFLDALLHGQRKAAFTVAREALHEGHTLLELYGSLFQESLYEVGRLWESGAISVAMEHMATAITQHVMSQLYLQMPPSSFARGRAVVSGVQGELHHIGANMVADVLEADGWDVRFLGSNLPDADILRAVDDHRAHLLCLSTTMLFSVSKIIRLLSELRSATRRPRVFVGGAAFRATPGLWSDIGADGFAADLEGLLELARPLGCEG